MYLLQVLCTPKPVISSFVPNSSIVLQKTIKTLDETHAVTLLLHYKQRKVFGWKRYRLLLTLTLHLSAEFTEI